MKAPDIEAIVSYTQRHRQVPARVFFSLIALLVATAGLVEPTTPIYKVNQLAGVTSHLNNLVMGVSALLALGDVVVNDILPARFRFFCNRRHRHIIWCVLALTFLNYALLFTKMGQSGWTCALYTLFGMWGATIGAMDVVYELKERYSRG